VSTHALAVVAGVLSHITKNTTLSFGYYMARPKSGGGDAAITRMRFSKLIAIQNREDMHTEDWNELLTTTVRIIRQLDNVANIVDVTSTLYWWNERSKANLVRNYYENLLPSN
jgi:hypothetical protein